MKHIINRLYYVWILKGFILGIAILIPGLSVGTLAIVMNVYEKALLACMHVLHFIRYIFYRYLFYPIASDFISKKYLPKSPTSGGAISEVKKSVVFLIFLTTGILLALLTLANIMSILLKHYPMPVYFLFLGLVIASLPTLLKKTKITVLYVFCMLISASVVFGVSYLITPSSDDLITTPSFLLCFLSGFLATATAVLPGLSGSMMLLLMGTYHFFLTAITVGLWIPLTLFLAGGLMGGASAVYFIHQALQKYKAFLFAIINGFVIGSVLRLFTLGAENLSMQIFPIFIALACVASGVLVFYLIQRLSPLK